MLPPAADPASPAAAATDLLLVAENDRGNIPDPAITDEQEIIANRPPGIAKY
ncbi:hypothetical protein AB0H34_32545 [Saccharopolyspora shandongensis]|uniref:hypothetical protein n=1 Tax=Saccharopolyspora shandongensis TaxID=418495 RepID=UPI0034021B1C